MNHPHNHHDHAPVSYGHAFAIGTALNLGFVSLELVYGSLAHSLALISDAAHNFSDVFALLLAWVASVLVRRNATWRYTYGMRRASILAALINATLLMVVTGGIGWEAVRRLATPEPVGGGTVMAVAALGILVNGITAALFMSGRKNDLNVRATFQHMAADALVALGVVVAGGAILITRWLWLDPLVSLLIGVVILASTWGLLREAINLALDAVPRDIDARQVQNYLQHLSGVSAVHDLHIWAMSTTETALTAHLVLDRPPADNAMIERAAEDLHSAFGIEHVTLQREIGNRACDCHPCVPVAP
jgi:cobalt-zinc-cadmium efflux system protein